MFSHHKSSYKRSTNPLFVIFRLALSLIIFGVLLIGGYYAYRQFSGYDPVKLSPTQFLKQFTSKEALMNTFIDLISVGTKGVNPTQDSKPSPTPTIQTEEPAPNSPLSFKFALVADSENDNENLAKALNLAKNQKADFIIMLGDLTNVGTVDELTKTKAEFDKIGIRYFVTPGDHDLWDARDKKKSTPEDSFISVFGPAYQSFSYKNAKFLIINDADNYIGLGSDQKTWLDRQLGSIGKDSTINLNLAFTHEPLYHPSSDHFMGDVTTGLIPQAKETATSLQKAGISEVFSGDTHFFTRYTDPDNNLKMTTIGAITAERNPQIPRFGMVSVYENGEYRVEDVEIK